MEDYERALEIAGTGVGVVFLALVALTLVTLLLTRYVKEKNEEDEEKEPLNPGPPNAEPEEAMTTIEPTEGKDPAAIAAMVAAIQVIRGSVTRVPMRPLPSCTAPTVGAWRSQGRQALMQSQGVSSTRRTRR